MSRCTRDCGALCSPAPVSTTASAYLLRCERQSTHRSAIQKSWEPSSWTGWAGPARKTIISVCVDDEGQASDLRSWACDRCMASQH
ncbi:uncharacterized protein LOC144121932 isoform X3 [Amblyomma americanum]